MKKGVFSAVLAVCLTAAVLILPIVNSRSLRKEEKPDKVDKSPSVIVDNKNNDGKTNTAEETAESDRTVTFIVAVNGESLLDRLLSSKGKYQNVAELLLSGEGKQCSDNMKKTQAVVKASIQKIIAESDFTDSFTYTAVFSGFSVKAPLSSYEQLQKIKDVKSVTICNYTEYTNDEDDEDDDEALSGVNVSESTDEAEDLSVLSEPDETDESKNSDSSESEESDGEKKATLENMSAALENMMNLSYAYDNGYTGSGGLIAVIDDEFDCSHSAFSALPDNPKYTESNLNELFTSAKFNINTSYSFKDVYKSGKIIFAYDYADNDNETYSGGDSHGTHVAGIAAGNNGKTGDDSFKGVAYYSQLALMKVSTDEESKSGIISNTDAVFAALDDSVKLGADVINCSFGSARNIYGTSIYQNISDKLSSAGIVLVTSAGNDSYNGSDMSDRSVLDTSYIDYGTISDLGLLSGSFTAASVENSVSVVYKLKIGDEEIQYKEPEFIPENEEDSVFIFSENIPTDTEYAYLDAQGESADYGETDVFGKVAVLTSGELSVEEQAENAYFKGAAGILILTDKDDITVSSAALPIALVSEDYEEFFSENPEGSLAVYTNGYLDDSHSVGISANSSYGVTPDLKLKPDITAVGGHVLSGTDNDNYRIMSGTSMASPCTAGALMILKEYAENSPQLSGLTQAEKSSIIKALLMSNADVMKYDSENSDFEDFENSEDTEDETEESEMTDDMNTVDGNRTEESGEAEIDDTLYCTPRLSGAGMINIERAVSSEVYLTAEDSDNAKINMGDSISGEYTFEVTVHNLSDKTEKYSVRAAIQTDSFEAENDRFINTLVPYSLAEGLSAVVSINGKNTDTVTVAANSEQTFTVNIVLDSTTVLAYRNFFPNGFYVDGYIFLDSENTSVNMPIMGFCGDWSAISLFDNTIYDSEKSRMGLNNALCAVSDSDPDSAPYILGLNQFTGESYTENIIIGKDTVRNANDNSYLGNAYILPCFYLFRDAYNFTVTISTKEGRTLFTHNYGTVGSFRSAKNNPYDSLMHNSSDIKEFFSTLAEGRYIYTVSAETMGSDGSLTNETFQSFSFAVDNTRPNDISHKTYEKDGKIYLELTAKDETALQGFQLYTAIYNNQTQKYDYADELDSLIEAGYLSENAYHIDEIKQNSDGSVTFLYDITNLRSQLGQLSFYNSSDIGKLSPLKVVYKAVDYAFNTSYARTVDTVVYGSAEFQFTDQNKKPVSGVRLSFDGIEKTSDENGIIQFNDLLTNVYEADITELPDNYTVDKTKYLISVVQGSLNGKVQISLHFDGEYEESSEDISEEELSADESSEGTDSQILTNSDIDSNMNSEKDTDNPYYALAFVGTILIISVGALLLSKYRKRDMNTEE